MEEGTSQETGEKERRFPSRDHLSDTVSREVYYCPNLRLIASHVAVLAGVDFFTGEVLTWQGLATLRLVLPTSGNKRPDISAKFDTCCTIGIRSAMLATGNVK